MDDSDYFPVFLRFLKELVDRLGFLCYVYTTIIVATIGVALPVVVIRKKGVIIS